jgi:hypothetical protein
MLPVWPRLRLMQRPRFRRFSGVEEETLILLAGNCNAADSPATTTEEDADTVKAGMTEVTSACPITVTGRISEALSVSFCLSNRFIVYSGYEILREAKMVQVWILGGDLIGG